MFPDQYNMYNGTKNYQNKTMKGTKKNPEKWNEMFSDTDKYSTIYIWQ